MNQRREKINQVNEYLCNIGMELSHQHRTYVVTPGRDIGHRQLTPDTDIKDLECVLDEINLVLFVFIDR